MRHVRKVLRMCCVQEDSPHDDPGEENAQNVKTKADLRKTGLPRTRLCLAFLDDRQLQKLLRIFVDGAQPLHNEFAKHLEDHKPGSYGMLAWHARRASGQMTQETICATLNLLSSSKMAARLAFTPAGSVPLDIAELPEEAETAEVLYKFLTELAGNRAWSQQFLSLCLPYICSRVFLPDRDAREEGTRLVLLPATAMRWRVRIRTPEGPNN